jgi:Lrp/AsnC family transcriptional regulator for asnA, asnC and gidA
MVDIDLKDRKILYQLDLNCRQSNAKIGKKVGLSKQVVDYRIKRMEDEGLIKNYWALIDTFKLGYDVLRVYLQFQNIPSDVKKEIIQHFVNYKYTWVVYSSTGLIDFGSLIWVQNNYEFYQFLQQTLDRYGRFIAQKIVSLYVKADEYEKSYLLPDEGKKNKRIKFTITCSDDIVNIDNLDYKILNMIALNARSSLIDLAGRLKTSSQTVNYRLTNLCKNGVIKAFRVNIDISRLGFQLFDLRINLIDHSYRKKIIDYIENKPFFKCLNTSFGYADVELELIMSNIEKVEKLMDELDETFPNTIRNYHLFKLRETHKERWLPEMDFLSK